MSEPPLRLYKADVEIEDDPAHYGATVLVMATSRKEALDIAKKKALDSYYYQSGGYGSSATKVTHATCSQFRLPTQPGHVMTAGSYER